MEEYVVYIAHKGVYHWGDKPKPLKAQNLIEALKEIKGLCEGDINIYVIYLYEKTSRRNEYDLLMKSYDGKFFCVVELNGERDCETLKKHTRRVDGEITVSFEPTKGDLNYI